MEILKVKCSDIVSNGNIRGDITNASVLELADSIKVNGLFSPLLVRRNEKKDKYTLIAGHRRFKAIGMLGWEDVEVVVVENYAIENTTALQIIENIQRENLGTFVEAKAIRQALLEGKFTYKDLSSIMGKSINYIIGRDRLNELIGPYRKAVEKEHLKLSIAIMIAKLTSEQQKKLIKDFGDDEYDLRQLDENDIKHWMEQEVLSSLKNVPWLMDDIELIKNKPCLGCTDNSLHSSLFPDIEKKNLQCLDRKCFELKKHNYFERMLRKMKDSGTNFILITEKHGKVEEFITLAKVYGTDFWNVDRWRKYDKKAGVREFIGVMMDGPSYGSTFSIMDMTEIEMKKQQKASNKNKEEEKSDKPTPIGEKGDDGKTVDDRYWRRLELIDANENDEVIKEMVKQAMTIKFPYKFDAATCVDLDVLFRFIALKMDYNTFPIIETYTGIESFGTYADNGKSNADKMLKGCKTYEEKFTRMMLVILCSKLSREPENNLKGAWVEDLFTYCSDIGVKVQDIIKSVKPKYDEKREKYLDNFVTKNKRKPVKKGK